MSRCFFAICYHDKRLLVILAMIKPLIIPVSDIDSNVEASIGLKPFENVNHLVGKLKQLAQKSPAVCLCFLLCHPEYQVFCGGQRLAWGYSPCYPSLWISQSPLWLYDLCFREKLRDKSECFKFGVLLVHLARRHLRILTEAKNKVNINSRWHGDEPCKEQGCC